MAPLTVSSPIVVAVSGVAPPMASFLTGSGALDPLIWDATWSAMVALCVCTISQASMLLAAVVRGRV